MKDKIYENRIVSSSEKTKWYNRLLLGLIGLVESIFLFLIVYLTAFPEFKSIKTDQIYSIIAVDMVLIWVGILIGYYTWAIYFYNINLGLTNEDWAEIRMRKAQGKEVDERMQNPNNDQTLGLPEGTIRGTLALSLAVGALAMMVASLGKPSTWPANQVFVDAFDFFKTAFLMMIAFYFGNKSIESLQGMSKPKILQNPVLPGQNIQPPAVPGVVNVNTGAPATQPKTIVPQGDVAAEGEESPEFNNPAAKG